MSRTKNSILSILKVFEDLIRSRNHTKSGIRLTVEQEKIYCDALVLLLCCWYDSIQPKASGAIPRWAKSWSLAITSMDVSDLAALLKDADGNLIYNAEDRRSYESFKRSLSKEYPQAGAILSPLKGLVEDWYSNWDTSSFAAIHMCLVFISRLNLPGLLDLQAEAYESYVDGETRLSRDSDFTDTETNIIASWFPLTSKSFLYENWHPKHGRGSVADAKTSIEAKYQAFGRDCGIDRLDLLLGGNTMPQPVDRFLDRTAKVVFVPKSLNKLRTICMEPATLQWYQQGFMRSIILYIDQHEYLRRRISLDDQSLSQDLACEGSVDGSFATIDLQSASDSVSWSMVKQWTRRSSLLSVCGLTRSKACQLPDGKVMATKKFAPMGSALCFPMECIIFCAIVEAAILSVGGLPRKSKYRVYGDDIIVEQRYAEEVTLRLSRNGFRVNLMKSFWHVLDHNFRESCGGEYMDGMDVTPIRLSRRFAGYSDSRHLSPSSIAACVDLCNLSFRRLPTVRRLVVRSLLELP